jgi:Pentapeptide repeats (8 copies)
VTSDEDVPVTSDEKRKRPIWKWACWLTVVAISLGILIYLGIIFYQLVLRIPYLLARHHTNPSVESAYISGVAALLGVGATAVVAIAALWWSRSTNKATLEAAKATTAETIAAARETNRATIKAAKATTAETVAAALETNRATIKAAHADVRHTLDTTREGQIADRYTKAIEQLGSGKLDGRIGGIYALQLVARASPRERPAVINVLAAFIRERSHEPWPDKAAGTAGSPQRTARPDVLAAISVIRQRDPKNDPTVIDLTSAVFEDAELKGADLSGVILRDANFIDADLTGADLTGADLIGADLTRADLIGADLKHAHLYSADFTRADLTGADLTGADLTVTKFIRATLIRAKLDSFTYNLELHGPYLTEADLTEARWPLKARTPEGWVRDTDSGLLKPADAALGDAR